MAIPQNITKQSILDALQYIAEDGIPDDNQSVKYDLVDPSGKKYPPKYVIAVANHLTNGTEIATDFFDAAEARALLERLQFKIEMKQEQYELTITADHVTSTDERFFMNNLNLGDNYKPLDSYFRNAAGKITRRKYNKGEQKKSNQTMPRLACQVFEHAIAALSVEEKEAFPICQYLQDSEMIHGIFTSVDEYRAQRNTLEYLQYHYGSGQQFVFYCWNIFSTIIFIQECLKRFGRAGDEFLLIYREKDEKEKNSSENKGKMPEKQKMEPNGYKNPYSSLLLQSKNIVFRGAPGTGKTYLAREIATDIISNGRFSSDTQLSKEQKQQIGFVQFHPSYDYTDFVEGLRPKTSADGSIGFELQDGVFKQFVSLAIKNLENSRKTEEIVKKETSVWETITNYLSSIELGTEELQIARGAKFYITDVDDKNIYISIPENTVSKSLRLKISELQELLKSGQKFSQVKDVTRFFGKLNNQQGYSYTLAIFHAIKAQKASVSKTTVQPEKLKPYIFIIDEINRGEISKILGELFFSIDPGYRGKVGEVSTQYANLHDDPNEKFYIPENVYIIGTMNDIDRSVDSFDFAMRRRFRFIEIKAEDRLEMLDCLGDKKEDAIARMTALNQEISKVEGLNENYHIGASYFLKLKELDKQQLWADYLAPLLREYVRGMYDEAGIMARFEVAFSPTDLSLGDTHDGN